MYQQIAATLLLSLYPSLTHRRLILYLIQFMVCGLEEKDKGLAVGLFHDVLRQVFLYSGAVGGGRYHERDRSYLHPGFNL